MAIDRICAVCPGTCGSIGTRVGLIQNSSKPLNVLEFDCVARVPSHVLE